MNEGKLSNIDVVGLLFELHPEMPDTKAVVSIVEAITKLSPQLRLDLTPLYQDVEKIENKLKTITQQTSELNRPRPSPYA